MLYGGGDTHRELRTPLIDRNLMDTSRLVQEEASAVFCVLSIAAMAFCTLGLGFSKSLTAVVAARFGAGVIGGALIARWDKQLIRSLTEQGRRIGADGSVIPDHLNDGQHKDKHQSHQPCVQANSAAWLMGFTLAPLLGIFFQQRAFSRWKATLKLPMRVAALPANLQRTRWELPALPPCIGGALALIAVSPSLSPLTLMMPPCPCLPPLAYLLPPSDLWSLTSLCVCVSGVRWPCFSCVRPESVSLIADPASPARPVRHAGTRVVPAVPGLCAV